MNINSIRWRLPLSYAAIALLAALSLGSIMLLVLNSYYASQEREYLTANAEALQPFVVRILQSQSSGASLQSQVNGLAFLSQSQIRVLDASGSPIADSGIPDASRVMGVSGAKDNVVFNIQIGTPAPGMAVSIFSRVDGPPPAGTTPQVIAIQESGPALPVDALLPVSASPYGYGFSVASRVPEPSSSRRSSQVISVQLMSERGTSLGTLEFSHGPAYGEQILDAVSLAWLLASIIAIALAGLAGWFASQQVTRPVLALTTATRQMEQGNLSVRASLTGEKQADEFHTLALSFNSMAQRVEDTVSTLRAFVSDAAHELNTPLTALKTNLELAANETDPDQKAIFLTRAIEQNRRLELLTAGLLDLSRIEVSQSAPDPEPVKLRALVAEAAERFASRAEQAERSFALHLPESEITVQGDGMQLHRALDNLLENALKFTPKSGAIELQMQQKDDQVILIVSDTGIGILPEDLPQLFSRFHRGRNSAEFPGNGLGLAIVKAIATAHGGQVQVESAGKEQGSRFTLVLPVG